LVDTIDMPKVSVLMSVFNSAEHLRQAIESILNQSYSDFEFIIVDDASSDDSVSIIDGYAKSDSRIEVLKNTKNLKLAYSLNKGIKQAKGEYIARMDSDDVAHLDRLQKQVEFMEARADVGVCGAWVSVYELPNVVWKTAITPLAANCAAFFESCFHHPTVMMRKSVLDTYGSYDEKVEFAQDCHLWSRLAFDHGVKLVNLPEVLLKYRTHPEKKRDDYRVRQHAKASELRHLNLNRLGIDYSDQEYTYHDVLCSGKPLESAKEFQGLIDWMKRLEGKNSNKKLLDKSAFRHELSQKLLRVCLLSSKHTLSASKQYMAYCGFDDFLKNSYRTIRMVMIFMKSMLFQK